MVFQFLLKLLNTVEVLHVLHPLFLDFDKPRINQEKSSRSNYGWKFIVCFLCRTKKNIWLVYFWKKDLRVRNNNITSCLTTSGSRAIAVRLDSIFQKTAIKVRFSSLWIWKNENVKRSSVMVLNRLSKNKIADLTLLLLLKACIKWVPAVYDNGILVILISLVDTISLLHVKIIWLKEFKQFDNRDTLKIFFTKQKGY